MTADEAPDDSPARSGTVDDATIEARGRALASPLRMRILRLCLHESRTNRELAEELQLNPGTMLHHVRSLVDNGFLRAEEPRRGRRGSREMPYRATKVSWGTPVVGIGPILLETFLQEIDGLAPDDLDISRLGLKLNAAHLTELRDRVRALLEEYAAKDDDADGAPISLFFASHPDLPRSERGL